MKTGTKKNRIGLVLLLILGWLCFMSLVCFGRAAWLAGSLESQHQARRWQGESDRAFSQISCFLPQDSRVSLEQLYQFRQSAAAQLLEAVPGEDVAALYRDCWSGSGAAEVASALGRGTAQVTAVGGAFFEFHPIRLLSGSYLAEGELMKDRVLLDEELAWLLFGGTELQGLSLKINGQNFVVAGVVDRNNDRENRLAWPGETMGLYMSYEAWEAMDEKAGADCYEFVMARPVKGFALNFAREKFPVKTAEILDNSERFGFSLLWELVSGFGRRSMHTEAIAYPYWENAARATEDWYGLLLLLGCAFAAPPLLLLLVLGIMLLHRGRGKLREELLPRAVENTQEAIRIRQRRRWERKHGLHEKK